MIKVEPMIRIAGVSKTFSVKDNKVEALKNVSLDIARVIFTASSVCPAQAKARWYDA